MPRKVPQTNVRTHPISRRSPRERRSSASGPKQTSERELNSTLGMVSALETKLNELRKTGNIVARTNKGSTAAIAYLRTSSAANVGADRDSERRRRQAIEGFAKRGGFDVVAEFYDAAVSGADPIQDRPGFAQLLDLRGGACAPLRISLAQKILDAGASLISTAALALSLRRAAAPEKLASAPPDFIGR